jgi:hypothetical protein
MLSPDRLEYLDRRPGRTLPARSCGETRHRVTFPRVRGRGFSALATALIVAALPKCPMCLLAYAGFLGSLGLGSSASTALYVGWLLPASALFLGLTVVLLAFGARRRRGYGPAIVATVSGAAILLGKFRLDCLPLVYAGLLLIWLAVLWNAWSTKRP